MGLAKRVQADLPVTSSKQSGLDNYRASTADAFQHHYFTGPPLAPGLKACFFARQAMINATAIKVSSAQGKETAPALLRSKPA